MKLASPPTTFDTGSAMKTPVTEGSTNLGKIIVSGITRITLRNKEKNIARPFFSSAIKVDCPENWKDMNT
jgi:hypothetical protein